MTKCVDHCGVKCLMDFNVNYVSDNTGANEPNSKPAWGKSSVEQIDKYQRYLVVC